MKIWGREAKRTCFGLCARTRRPRGRPCLPSSPSVRVGGACVRQLRQTMLGTHRHVRSAHLGYAHRPNALEPEQRHLLLLVSHRRVISVVVCSRAVFRKERDGEFFGGRRNFEEGVAEPLRLQSEDDFASATPSMPCSIDLCTHLDDEPLHLVFVLEGQVEQAFRLIRRDLAAGDDAALL